VSPLTISELKQQAGDLPLAAAVLAQLQSRHSRHTKANKPYLELVLADSTGHFALKVWSDAPAYDKAEALASGAICRLEAAWTQGGFGLEARDIRFQQPEPWELDAFFAGDPVIREKQERDYADIRRLCATISDPRMAALCERFFEQFGERFRRTAAARRNHHARRGGLVEHVAQMMRSAAALCPVYPELNRDLLLTGTLFHDCGKLWENAYPERGFNQDQSLYGEMLGHIPLGIELVNKLWREGLESAAADHPGGQPAAEEIRLHLLHLIGSHHGEYEYGSPVLPRTPEAFALHYIDNLDAKLEMVRDAYAQAKELAPGIYERAFPLPCNLVKPLPAYTPPPPDAPPPETPA
jgi:3'-5' exoribonuclease